MPTRHEWNERYRSGSHATQEPDPFLVACRPWFDLPPSEPRTALDLACGAGRNALWLARQGFETTAVDFSSDALQLVSDRAAESSISIETREVDLEAEGADLGAEQYDLITVIQFLYRPLFDAIERALKPGGLLVFKTYTVDQLLFEDGPRNPLYLLDHNELLERFARFRVLRYEERQDGAGTAALLAQKPGEQASAFRRSAARPTSEKD